MQRSTDRIYTTHVGSLARPAALLDLMRAAAAGEPVERELAGAQRGAVAAAVGLQRGAGLDVINDGEQGKTGFFTYILQRLSGYEPRPGESPLDTFRAEVDEFPEYYEQYFKSAMTGGMAVPAVSVACTGPVSYIGQQQIARDLAALRAAVGEAGRDEVFVCAVAPSGVGGNEYYRSESDYLDAVADALHVEYAAIVDAGFTLQIDDPFLTDVFSYGAGSLAEKLETAALHDAPLADLIETLLTIEAGGFSFEAANPRHEHAFHVFETVALPPDTVLLPGVISHATNIVEHPLAIADRIVRFADLVGRENVVASAGCGFSSQATYAPEIHPKIVAAKFEALAEGARRASARLW
jgi:5-methyltetrahydropteroyltriglutamate--homocysteine methyltransferase